MSCVRIVVFVVALLALATAPDPSQALPDIYVHADRLTCTLTETGGARLTYAFRLHGDAATMIEFSRAGAAWRGEPAEWAYRGLKPAGVLRSIKPGVIGVMIQWDATSASLVDSEGILLVARGRCG
jgi:hypothetical protein